MDKWDTPSSFLKFKYWWRLIYRLFIHGYSKLQSPREWKRSLGKTVVLIAEKRFQHDASHYTVKCPDGVEIVVTLPPGEYLESNYAQMVGKVVKANAIDVFSMNAVSNNFDMQIYNTAINLSLSQKFSNLF